MSLYFSNFLPTLLLLLYQHMEFTKAQSFSVIQTPSSLNVVEGTDLKIKCKTDIPKKVWFVDWYVNRNDGKWVKLKNTNHISIAANINDKWSSLTLKRADMTDSGIYVCAVGSAATSDENNNHIHNNGTQVTVNELTNLMVNQTPVHTIEKEGANVTIQCRFRTVSNYSTMYVRWHKEGQNVTYERYSITMIQDLESGFASLTLKNTKKDDSGSYVCEVGSRSRNVSGSGTPSQIVITGKEKMQSSEGGGAGIGLGLGVGVGAGVGVLLTLLIGVFVWRRKQKSPMTTPEQESLSTIQGRRHPPLANQESDVTYADLKFNKRGVKPDAEVIYAEVKLGRK